ncbi:MAG: hypothetical protein AB2693_34720, partial [Candidatus Thiodiazotropha sp.]
KFRSFVFSLLMRYIYTMYIKNDHAISEYGGPYSACILNVSSFTSMIYVSIDGLRVQATPIREQAVFAYLLFADIIR